MDRRPLALLEESKAIERYLLLMQELVNRIELAAAACDGKLRLTPPYAREYCYLQFRRMCELIALGCLQLHGDLPTARTKALTKEWHAERIMKLLHKNHPHSFPQCLTSSKIGDVYRLDANSKPNALTLNEFKKLYNECGEVLHRGSIRTLEANDKLEKGDYDRVIRWHQKIVDLMNEHMIARLDKMGMYVVALKTPAGGPSCNVFSGFSDGAVNVAKYHLNVARPGDISS